MVVGFRVLGDKRFWNHEDEFHERVDAVDAIATLFSPLLPLFVCYLLAQRAAAICILSKGEM